MWSFHGLLLTLHFMGDYFRFGSDFIQTEIFLKKPKPVQANWFRFGSVRFFRTKTGSNRFGSVFSGLVWFFWFGSVFFRLGSIFSVSGL